MLARLQHVIEIAIEYRREVDVEQSIARHGRFEPFGEPSRFFPSEQQRVFGGRSVGYGPESDDARAYRLGQRVFGNLAGLCRIGSGRFGISGAGPRVQFSAGR